MNPYLPRCMSPDTLARNRGKRLINGGGDNVCVAFRSNAILI